MILRWIRTTHAGSELQNTLPHSAEITAAGYVAGASHDTILEETPVENVMAMFDAVLEYSRDR